MTAADIAATTLLVAGIAIEIASTLGVLVMPNVYARLHFVTPASTLGPAFVAGAVFVDRSFSQGTLKAGLVAILLIVAGPMLTHATARAARVHELGHWKPRSKAEAGIR